MTTVEGRRLVAVMRADAVASTRWLNEHGVPQSIEARQRAYDAILAASPRGRVLDTRGDGVLMAFDNVADALGAAWALQHDVERPATDPDLRVGVTLGELHEGELTVAIDDHSKRLESTCASGRVLVDDAVRRTARDLPELRFERGDTTVEGDPTHELVARSPNGSTAASRSRLEAVLISDLAASEATAEETSAVAISEIQDLARPCVLANNGRVVDTNRAGLLATFPSCTEALAAAEAIHRAGAAAGLEAGAGRPRFRVAVTFGDVTHSTGSVHGSAVVEAARLLELASDSCTVASGDVMALAQPLDGRSAPLGPIELRDLEGMTSVHRVEATEQADAVAPLPPGLSRVSAYPLVGREQETEAVARLWERTVGGEVTSLIVSGEEGIGKTRLVQEVAAEAHRGGAIVLHGLCLEDLTVPYAPLAQALSRASAIDDELRRAAADLTGPLGLMLAPSTEPSAEETAPATTEQAEVSEAVVATLRRLADRRPLLLVVDDLQWADPATVRMLGDVVTSGGSERVAVVTTCRVGPEPPDQLTRLLAVRTGHRRPLHLALDRLAPPGIAAMLSSRIPSGRPHEAEGVSHRLAEMSGGSPLHLEELIDHLTLAGSLTHTEPDGWRLELPSDDSLPPTIIDLVSHRANRLGPDTAELLAHAAVMGNTFELDVLAEVVDRPLSVVIDAIEAADRAGLVHESEAGGSCIFADEVVRAAMLREVRPTRRAVVHEAIARVLERLRPREIDRLAMHWGSAMGATAGPKAVEYQLLAGKRDMAAAAWEASIERHRQVIGLLGVDNDELLAGEAHHALGLSLRRIGDDDHRASLTRAADIARRHESGELLGRSAIAMMRPGSWYPEADVVDHDIVAMCEDALLLLEDADPMRPRVLAALATNLAYANEPEKCMTLVREAQALAREHGDLRLIGTTLAAELISFHAPDRFARRRELADEVRRIGRATADRDLLFVGSCFVIADHFAAGRIDEAEPLVAEVTSLAAAMRQYFPSFLVGQFEVTLAIARSAPDATDLIDALREKNQDHPVGWFGVSIIQSAAVADGQGTLSDMLVSLFEAAGEYEVPSWARKWNYALSRAYLEAGDHAAAVAAIEMNPEPDFDAYWLASLYHVGLLGLETKDRAICESVIEKLTPYRGRIALIGLSVCMAGQISTALGQAHQGLGRLDEAAELFREAMDQADGLGFPFYATLARRSLAQVLLAIDPTDDEARALLRQALATAERFGFALERRRASALIDSTG